MIYKSIHSKANENAMFRLCCIRKKQALNSLKVKRLKFISLTHLDSNQERQNQNLQCYHYTMGQYLFLRCNCNQNIFFDEQFTTKFFR